MIKISVITINYNNAAGLEKTLASVAAQKNVELEYVVIDGGSTDGSVEVIQKFSEHITHWMSEKDSGIYNAMNKGLRKATGDYCLFLNSGDYLYNEHVLATVQQAFSGEDILYGHMQINWGKGNLQIGKMPERITFEQMWNDTLWHPVSFIKRELFHKYGVYDESFRLVGDYDLFFRLIVMHSVSLKQLDAVISVYNVEGISSAAENKLLGKKERSRVKEKYLPLLVREFAEKNIQKKEESASFYTRLKKLFQ